MEIRRVSGSLQASGSRAMLPHPEKQEQNGPMHPLGVSLSLDIRQKHMLPPGALERAAVFYHHLVTQPQAMANSIQFRVSGARTRSTCTWMSGLQNLPSKFCEGSHTRRAEIHSFNLPTRILLQPVCSRSLPPDNVPRRMLLCGPNGCHKTCGPLSPFLWFSRVFYCPSCTSLVQEGGTLEKSQIWEREGLQSYGAE